MGVPGPWVSSIPVEPQIIEDPGNTQPATTLGDQALTFFDQYSRYASAAEAIRANLGSDGATVLDVGSGHARLLGGFLPGVQVTYLDPLLEDATDTDGEDVLPGTLDQLESSDRRWDWALAVDTLEHVPAAERSRFLDLMLSRVEHGVILSGPYDEDAAAHRVDDRVNEVYRSKTGSDYSCLEEHMSFGLPGLAATREHLRAAGFETIEIGNGHAPWLDVLLPMYVCYLDEPEHVQVFRELSSLFNEHLYRFDHFEPSYRRILIGRRVETPVEPERLADSPTTRAEAAQAWADFWAQLVARMASHADRLVARIPKGPDPLIAVLEGQIVELQQRSAADVVNYQELSRELLSSDERLTAAQDDRQQAREELVQLHASMSWKITAPMRAMARFFGGVFGRPAS